MNKLPFRTGKTWLLDDHLVLLDVLFVWGTSFQLLGREHFLEQWNLGYAHNFNRTELECNLRWLCEHGVLEQELDADQTCYQITRHGGELWSQERCPCWERYCIERYSTTTHGRTRMAVMAVSAQVLDDFLNLWPQYPARRRTTIIADHPLIGWHPFPRVYVGVATYEEPRSWTPKEYLVWVEKNRQHWAMLERERSWWRCVPELQRFLHRETERRPSTDLPCE